MKRIGIITHYFKNKNYGGNLQAYALSEIITKQGFYTEQICFDKTEICLPFFKRIFSSGIIGLIKKIWCFPKKKIVGFLKNSEKKTHKVFIRRNKAMYHFNQKIIPHSDGVYNTQTIKECVGNYDVFITGSDQVWNFTWYHPPYFLDFVPSDKIKMSYAASIAKNSLTKEQKEIFKKSLKDYKAVSVREPSAVKLLEGLSPVEVKTTLDPTLLLRKEDWDEVCADRVIEEEYCFCYFLGENKEERKIATDFAKKHNLKLVFIPHATGVDISLPDLKMKGEKLYEVSPEQFLSLIKHAKYVFTDSFHAVVFSNIYQKQYFVFNRSKKGEMSSRIVDITALFNQSERFCAGKERETLEYVESLSEIDYSQPNEKFEQLKKESIEFLISNIQD